MAWPASIPPIVCPRCGERDWLRICEIQGALCECCNRVFHPTDEQMRQLYGPAIAVTVTRYEINERLERCLKL
jgi:hypothetical protein